MESDPSGEWANWWRIWAIPSASCN
jgi:hypothetical protein